MKLNFFSLSLLLSFCGLGAEARIEMPHVFSDNMVLQADTAAVLWGKAAPGSTVTARGSWGAQSSAKTSADGRWRMTVSTPEASYTPLSLTVTDTSDNTSLTYNNVLAGEVWFASGQSNMEMPLRGFWNQPIEDGGEQIMFSRKLGRGIRFITVPKAGSYEPKEDIDAMWVESTPETAGEFSALAWFFATALRDMLDVPVGIISCAYGGSKVEGWEPASLIANYPDRDMKAEQADEKMNEWERVGVMYNAMLLPVAGYTLKGFLWNQGESNVGGESYYGARQADMLNHWRELWGNKDMQFYFVELPGWDYGDVNGTNAALFREAQRKAAADTEGAYIVGTADLVYPDEPDDIHARNKRPIGHRMAALAATHTYGLKGVPHTYPTFKNMDVNGGEATLYFNDAWQGFSPNDDLEGFEVAGEDRVFYPAKANIDRSNLSIKVSSPEVKEIKSVRYLFRNFAIGKIRDTYGMPLMPFRTDNWDK